MKHKFIFLVVFLLFISPVLSKESENKFKIKFPVNCVLGKDCFFFQYVDRDPSLGKSFDFRCGRMSYDTHSGTDISLLHEEQMKKGVEVLAVADGKVLATRNFVEDFRKITGEEVMTLECGNRVYIEHKDGWGSYYCHLMQGSVRVKEGQVVMAGDVLGLIGESGKAPFPHLHIDIIYNRKEIDPFVGPNSLSGCNVKEEPIWEIPYPYKPTGFIRVGFADRLLNTGDAWDGKFLDNELSKNAEVIVAWAHLYGILKNDEIQTTIFRPDGSIFAKNVQIQDKDQRIQIESFGKKNSTPPFQVGEWKSEFKLIRNGKLLESRNSSVIIK